MEFGEDPERAFHEGDRLKVGPVESVYSGQLGVELEGLQAILDEAGPDVLPVILSMEEVIRFNVLVGLVDG